MHTVPSVAAAAIIGLKAHLHAIHRKSGGRNRRELLSLLVDSLLAGKT